MAEKGKAFLQALAGGFYGAGASLAGVDPTGLAHQLDAQRQRKFQREELEAVEGALKAADPERYKQFMSQMPEGFTGWRNAQVLQQAWGNFDAAERRKMEDDDAAASIDYLAGRLKDFGRDPSSILNTNMSDPAKATELRRILEPLEAREFAKQDEIQQRGKLYQTMSDEELRSFAEEMGVPNPEGADRDTLIEVVSLAGLDPTNTGTGSRLKVQDPRDWARLEQMVGVPAEELQAIAADERIAFGEERQVLDRALEALAQLDRDRVKLQRWEAGLDAVGKEILADVETGKLQAKDIRARINEATETLAETHFGGTAPPHFAEDITTAYAAVLAGLEGKHGAVQAAQAWADPSAGNTTATALSSMSESEFEAQVKNLPPVQQQVLRDRRSNATAAMRNRQYLRSAVASVGGDPEVAALYGLADFARGGEHEDLLYSVNLDDMQPAQLAALAKVNQSVRLEDLAKQGPLIQGAAALGMSGAGKVSVLTAIRNGTLATDPAATSALMGAVQARLEPLVDGVPATSGEIVALSQTLIGLQKFSELEGVNLPPQVMQTLDRNAHVVQAMQNFPHVVEGISFDQAWEDALAEEVPHERFAKFHENLRQVPGTGTAAALEGLLSTSPSARSEAYEDLRREADAGRVLSAGQTHVRAFAASGGVFQGVGIQNGQVVLAGRDLADEKTFKELTSAKGTGQLVWLDEIGMTFSPEYVTASQTGDAKWRTRAMEIFQGPAGDLVARARAATTQEEKAALAIELNAHLKFSVGMAIIENNSGLNTFFGVAIPPPAQGDPFASSAGGVGKEALLNWRDSQVMVAERVRTQTLPADQQYASWNVLAATAATGYPGEEIIIQPVPTAKDSTFEPSGAGAMNREFGRPGSRQ